MEKWKILSILKKRRQKARLARKARVARFPNPLLNSSRQFRLFTNLVILYSRFHYILILLIIIVVYLIYLIGYYKVQEYRTDAFISSIEYTNNTVKTGNNNKVFLSSYIRTKAYATKVAKATQNKKLPGEEVINIVTEEEIKGNAEVDTHDVILQTREKSNDPTKNMTNPEKWWHLMTNGIGG